MVEVLRRFIPETRLFIHESMAMHTSFKIGGPAEFYVRIETADELCAVYNACRENGQRFTLLGCGSNVLVSDSGIRGVVTQLHPGFGGLRVYDNGRIMAQAGVSLAKLADTACRAGLDGLAFASGIPGSVGGALYMNAGAYGHELGEYCETADILMPDGHINTLSKAELQFGYRTSVLQVNGGMALSAVFALRPGDPEVIRAEMSGLNAKRKTTQPLEYASAGSVFKRPQGHFAGKLIEDAGLKGHMIGGAQVSEKHAGFIVNRGGASCDDVLQLVEHIRQTVYGHSGVKLEPEIRVID